MREQRTSRALIFLHTTEDDVELKKKARVGKFSNSLLSLSLNFSPVILSGVFLAVCMSEQKMREKVLLLCSVPRIMNGRRQASRAFLSPLTFLARHCIGGKRKRESE